MTRKRKKQAMAKSLKYPRGIPDGAIAADCSRQVPDNSYMSRITYYVDKHFTCIDCGSDETWTAKQQKWYYEVAKGTLYATAVRCRDCRNRVADAKARQREEMTRDRPPGIRLPKSSRKHDG